MDVQIWWNMNTQLYTQWLDSIVSPQSLAHIGEYPALLGITFAVLGLSLVVLRRRSLHHTAGRLVEEESLFPSAVTLGETGSLSIQGTFSASSAEELQEVAHETNQNKGLGHAGLELVDSKVIHDPHAYLRTLLAREGIALQELVSRANSLQLMVDSSMQHQSPSCLELLQIAQQILKSATQRHATAELLLDDAESESIGAARALLKKPLQIDASLTSGLGVHFNPKNDWINTTRNLLDDVESTLRISAVG